MVDLLLFVCARGSSTDRKTNNLSIFSIIEQITADSFPLLVPEIQVICIFGKRDTTETGIEFSIRTTLDESILHEGQIHSDFGEKNINRTHISMHGVLIPAPGALKVQLIYQGEPLGEWNITISSTSPTLFEKLSSSTEETQAP